MATLGDDSDVQHRNSSQASSQGRIGELHAEPEERSPSAAVQAVHRVRNGGRRGKGVDSSDGAKTAFVYVRVSTREQARTGGGDEGYSIPTQRTACHDRAGQLGAVVLETFTDAGESAKTANRPELQRMLQQVEEHRPTYVIVHKIDRLTRNRVDDIAINVALRKAGSELVSCTENISDTPSGKFLYNVMADMAQFYSDNLAQEVMKGLVAKAAEGGTPFRPPIGYVPVREYIDGVLVSSVAVDPERAPLITWAFERYATGDWTAKGLVTALREKGLLTRQTARRPAREVSLKPMLKILRNPYYMGVVSYQGVTYQGKHEALISVDTWLAVQDVLAVHAHAGEKDRVHQHYLRGTIFCGRCGKRLVFSQHTGRHGGKFDYFICPKRHTDDVHCPRQAIRVEKFEDGVLDVYSRFELPAETVSTIRLGVHAEMAQDSAEAHAAAALGQPDAGEAGC